MLRTLASEHFDLLVIGGGITGAGVAREASLRGLRVGLVEAGDFASGTSSRSTKMIHGGLRYLKNRDFRLVREAVHERMRLLRMAPHLVKVVPFLFPVYRGDPDSLFMLRVGLTLYDWFAGRANPIPHRIRSPRELLQVEPTLRADGLVGGALYCDAVTDDARLTLEVILSAVEHGAVVTNYAEVTGFLRNGDGWVAGVTVKDRMTGELFPIQATRVLAAGGPWADRIRQMDAAGAPELLRLTKGVHLTLPAARLPLRHAVVMRGRDGRLMFAVPAGPFSYVGTTDTDYSGDPGAPVVEWVDVAYILDAVQRLFPESAPVQADVVSTWAGLRPLLKPNKAESTSDTSRDYRLHWEPSGLVTVAGGKLTAFRHMASHIVDELFPATRGPHHLAPSLAPLPGARKAIATTTEAIQALAARTGAEPGLVERLAGRYGALFPGVVAELEPALPERPAGLRWLVAQLRHTVKREMAVRLEDVLARRTDTFLFRAGNGTEHIEALALEMGDLLGWTADRHIQEVAHSRAAVAAMFAWRS